MDVLYDASGNELHTYFVFQQDFLVQLDAKKSRVISLNLTSKELLDLQTEEGRDLQGRLRLMNRRWDAICSQSTRLQQELQVALMHCQEFHHTIHDLLLWLENIETKIQQCEPINLGNDEAALWSRLRKLQVCIWLCFAIKCFILEKENVCVQSVCSTFFFFIKSKSGRFLWPVMENRYSLQIFLLVNSCLLSSTNWQRNTKSFWQCCLPWKRICSPKFSWISYAISICVSLALSLRLPGPKLIVFAYVVDPGYEEFSQNWRQYGGNTTKILLNGMSEHNNSYQLQLEKNLYFIQRNCQLLAADSYTLIKPLFAFHILVGEATLSQMFYTSFQYGFTINEGNFCLGSRLFPCRVDLISKGS